TNVSNASGARVLSSGNTLSFYDDGGNIYEFGYECKECSGERHTNCAKFDRLTPTVVAGTAQVTENGPLRVTVTAPIDVTVLGRTTTFTLQYSLVAGSPYLEMALT